MQDQDSRPDGDKQSFAVNVAAPIEDIPRDEKTPATSLAVFDDNEVFLSTAPVRRGTATLTLPIGSSNRTLRVFHGLLDESIKRPTPARMRRNLAMEERLLVRPGCELKLRPLPYKHLRLSCCRVRGRIVMPVKRPDGSVEERPLCNARVTVCEVDASIPWIIRRLPNELVFRLRDEWLAVIRNPPGGPDPAPELSAVRAGLHLTLREDPMAAAQTASPLHQLAHTMAVAQIRAELIANLKLLRPFWCAFPWLDRFYSLDCLKTVDVDADGGFDTEIHYPCHGDHPDLYFKVEQDCHPGGWLTVYAPSIHCNTYWDYCCGTPVKLIVTHPQAAPGRAPSPCVWPYSAGDPASVGSWELLPYTSGVFVVHAALMHTGKVLLFSGTAEVNLPKESRVWDPDTGVMTAQSFGEDLFCCGHATLPDGRILINGGASTAGRGIRSTNIFDPVAQAWNKVADMNHARWYPTTLSLPDGRILTFSGRDQNGAVTAPMEVYDPAANTWTDLPASASKTVDIYPGMHLLWNGKILYTGTRWEGSQPWASPPQTALFDPPSNSWANVGNHVLVNRTEGTSVLLPPLEPAPTAHEHDHPEPPKLSPTLSRVLVAGGPGNPNTPFNARSAEIIDMADAAPAWRRIADMNSPRNNVNCVILPDAKVLFCTGIDGFKWTPNTPSLQAEMFDPQSETWTAMASMTVARQYHSVSVLLPDGRVLNTGSVGAGGNLMSMEVYSPPYLFRGPRPKLSSWPTALGYGAAFTVESPDACRIDKACLIKASTITHHTNTDQRYLRLHPIRHGHCGLRMSSPANARLAPPGYYLLFLLDDCGVPSVGRLIHIG